MATLEEQARRLKLEQDANRSFYQQYIQDPYNSMFDPVDPNAPKIGENIGGLPSYMNPTNQLMSGASVVDGNIVPGAGRKPGMFDSTPNIPSQEAFGSTYTPGSRLQENTTYNAQGRPTYSLPLEQQKIQFNPGSVSRDIGHPEFLRDKRVGFETLNEYDSRGLDKNFFGNQDKMYGEILFEDLNAQGIEKYNKGKKAVKEYREDNIKGSPFSDQMATYQEGLNKLRDEYAFGFDDLTKGGLKKLDVKRDADTGAYKNASMFGGIVNTADGTPGPNLKGRAYEGGDTLQETVTNAGMTLSGDGQVGTPTAQSLQYTGENVMQSFPARRDAITGGGGIIVDPEVYNMFQPGGQYGKATGEAAGGLLDGVGGITGAVGLLGDIMLMQSLLDNKQKAAPAAGIPRGQAGANVQYVDPYKRRF